MTFFVLAIIPLAETCEPDWEGFDPSRHELEQDQVSSETIAKLPLVSQVFDVNLHSGVGEPRKYDMRKN